MLLHLNLSDNISLIAVDCSIDKLLIDGNVNNSKVSMNCFGLGIFISLLYLLKKIPIISINPLKCKFEYFSKLQM